MSLNPRYVTPPSTGGGYWSNVNFGGSTTLTQVANSLYLWTPYNDVAPGSDNLVGIESTQAFSGSNPRTIICNVQYNMVDIRSTDLSFDCFCIGVSDGSGFQTISARLFDSGGLLPDDGQSLYISTWGNHSSINTQSFSDVPGSGGSPFSMNRWFMLRYDGTNMHYYMTTDDRQIWIQIYSGNDLTPTRAGIYCNARGVADINLQINSWQVLNY